jgi:hypothetical protein
MKRRVLLARTVTSAFSATIFAATGWLMGTRTLTMPPPGCGDPTCGGGLCGVLCWRYGYTCHVVDCIDTCKPYNTYGHGCYGAECACLCAIVTDPGPCGSPCPSPCNPN